ncbi:hypothetical protein V6Z11_D10G183600 [Gossypium hirsutum]
MYNNLEKSRKRLHLSYVYAYGASVQVSKLNFTPKFKVPTSDISDISACNGLHCLVAPKRDDPFYVFYVCNPILGEFITIQPPYKDRCRGDFLGLSYSTVTNQYKLLQSYYPTDELNCPMVEIYTIGSGTWRSIVNAPTDFSKSSLRGEFINSFDFDTEQFGIVPPPHHFQELDKCSSECTKTGVLGGCLFICHYPDFMQFDIWVMKEYGVKESWTKQFVIKHVYSGSYQPILVLSNGEIFMLSNYPKRTCYNQKGRYLRGAKSFWIPSKFDAISYTPCFVSLYNVAKGEQISRYYIIIVAMHLINRIRVRVQNFLSSPTA